jgi:hypothetical protein
LVFVVLTIYGLVLVPRDYALGYSRIAIKNSFFSFIISFVF